jgi:hypothetical protein
MANIPGNEGSTTVSGVDPINSDVATIGRERVFDENKTNEEK